MSFAEETAAFLTAHAERPLPETAARLATDAITDAIGCIALGAGEELEGPLRDAVFGEGATAKKVAGDLSGGSADRAQSLCLYLGTLAHAADFDDISHPAYCHPTAVLLPPLLLRGAALHCSGATLLSAHVAGIEVLGQLGRRLNMDHYRRGWHATGTFGAIGATAALALLEDLPEGRIVHALGIAASMASGLRQNFGTPTKPLHAGLAGRTALLATELAKSGFTSSRNAIDGDNGFVSTYGGAPGIAEPKPWGAPLEILTENGIALKAYPSCAATHAAVDATLACRAELGAPAPEAVKRIRVGASRHALQPLIHDWPDTPLEAKFSMRHCVAAAFLDGMLGLGSFAPDMIRRPDLHTTMETAVTEIDPRVAENPEFAAVVRVELHDGRVAEHQVDVASGKPGNWLSAGKLAAKFDQCAPGAEHIRTMALGLADLADVAPLLDALAQYLQGALGASNDTAARATGTGQ